MASSTFSISLHIQKERSYCRDVGITYHDSMVHWGPITAQQKDVFKTLLHYPGGSFIIGRSTTIIMQ